MSLVNDTLPDQTGAIWWSGETHLDSLQVYSVHDGALEESDGGEVSLDQSLQLQAWWCSAKEQDEAVPCFLYKSCIFF